MHTFISFKQEPTKWKGLKIKQKQELLMEEDPNVGQNGTQMFLKTGKAISFYKNKEQFSGTEEKWYKQIQIKFEDTRVEKGRNPALHTLK